MKSAYLLFDFDGTIADSINPLFDLLNSMAPDFGVHTVSWDEFDHMRDLNYIQIFKMLKIPLFHLPKAIKMVLEGYQQIIQHLQPCTGILELLSELQAREIPHSLLSSNSKKNLQAFLQKHQIQSFEWVEGTEGIMAKNRHLSKMIRKHGLQNYDLYYIGDEIRDIQTAKSNRIKSIAVSWGLHSHQHLQKSKPDYLVDAPSEILDIIERPKR